MVAWDAPGAGESADPPRVLQGERLRGLPLRVHRRARPGSRSRPGAVVGRGARARALPVPPRAGEVADPGGHLRGLEGLVAGGRLRRAPGELSPRVPAAAGGLGARLVAGAAVGERPGGVEPGDGRRHVRPPPGRVPRDGPVGCRLGHARSSSPYRRPDPPPVG